MKTLKLFFAITALLSTTFLIAQTPNAEALEKANKDLMKTIKKESGAAKIWVEVCHDDGYWYFRASVEKNDGPYGAYDQSGKAIAPLSECYSSLYYMPALPQGSSIVPTSPLAKKPADFKLSHNKVDGAFIARKPRQTNLISLNGSKITMPNDAMFFTIYPGWVVTNVHPGGSDPHGTSVSSDFLMGTGAIDPNIVNIYTSDGHLFLENINGFTIDKNQFITYSKLIDGVPKHGVKSLVDTNFDIPCIYAGVMLMDGKWMVNETRNSSSHEYTVAESTAKPSYRDDGEKLFETGDYHGVIQFYSTEGANAPWAKYFAGSAMHEIASSDLISKKKYIEAVEKKEWSKVNNPFYNKDFTNVDILTDIELILASKELFEQYLADGDTSFADHARIAIIGADDYLSNVVPFVNKNFEKAVTAHKNHNAAQAQKLEEQRAKQQQQAMIMVSMLNNIISSIASSQNNKSSGSRITSNASYSQQTKSSASAVEPVDNTSRKGFLKAQIIEWKNKLKKAETSRAQAFDNYQKDPTHTAKRALDSKENTVTQCMEMIRQYESELNSLK